MHSCKVQRCRSVGFLDGGTYVCMYVHERTRTDKTDSLTTEVVLSVGWLREEV